MLTNTLLRLYLQRRCITINTAHVMCRISDSGKLKQLLRGSESLLGLGWPLALTGIAGGGNSFDD